MNKKAVHFIAGKGKLEDGYKYPNVLPKINTSITAGMMESIKEYLRSHHGKGTLITKTVQTMCKYYTYENSDNKMIARMLHLPPDKNTLESSRLHSRVHY